MNRSDFYWFILLGVLCFATFGIPKLPQPKYQHSHPVKIMSAQQLASHYVVFQTDGGEGVSTCSSTAIGPHAFMTATHCVRGKSVAQVVIDLTIEPHRLLSVVSDGRDHVIFLIDGPAFQNYIAVVPVETQVNDVLTTYGSGGGVYPSVPKYGRVIDCEDPSDLDRLAHEFCTTLPVISGDSGAAVYNSKGEVAGLVTYAIDNERTYTNSNFALNFTQKQLDFARAFDGDERKLRSAIPDVCLG